MKHPYAGYSLVFPENIEKRALGAQAAALRKVYLSFANYLLVSIHEHGEKTGWEGWRKAWQGVSEIDGDLTRAAHYRERTDHIAEDRGGWFRMAITALQGSTLPHAAEAVETLYAFWDHIQPLAAHNHRAAQMAWQMVEEYLTTSQPWVDAFERRHRSVLRVAKQLAALENRLREAGGSRDITTEDTAAIRKQRDAVFEAANACPPEIQREIEDILGTLEDCLGEASLTEAQAHRTPRKIRPLINDYFRACQDVAEALAAHHKPALEVAEMLSGFNASLREGLVQGWNASTVLAALYEIEGSVQRAIADPRFGHELHAISEALAILWEEAHAVQNKRIPASREDEGRHVA